MANRKKRKARKGKGKGKVKNSPTGTSHLKTTTAVIKNTNVKEQNIQSNELPKSLPGDRAQEFAGKSNDDWTTQGILPIITRSGRIRKRNHLKNNNLQLIGNILKSELMIDDDNKKIVSPKCTSGNNTNNNNNDVTLNNKNNGKKRKSPTEKKNILSDNVKFKTKNSNDTPKTNKKVNKRNNEVQDFDDITVNNTNEVQERTTTSNIIPKDDITLNNTNEVQERTTTSNIILKDDITSNNTNDIQECTITRNIILKDDITVNNTNDIQVCITTRSRILKYDITVNNTNDIQVCTTTRNKTQKDDITMNNTNDIQVCTTTRKTMQKDDITMNNTNNVQVCTPTNNKKQKDEFITNNTNDIQECAMTSDKTPTENSSVESYDISMNDVIEKQNCMISTDFLHDQPNFTNEDEVEENQNVDMVDDTNTPSEPSDSNSLAVENMDDSVRADVLHSIRSVLASDDNHGDTIVETNSTNDHEAKVNAPRPMHSDNPQKCAVRIKHSEEQNDVMESKEVQSGKTKQVTLSNGVVLTLSVPNCDYCQKSFSSKSALSRHRLIHVDLRSYLCKHCPKKFHHPSTLKVHLQRYHPDVDRSPDYYICHICDKEFLLEENLNLHLTSHVKPENLNLKCLYCDKVFPQRQQLIEHEKTHLVTGKFKCYLCALSFSQRSRLSSHIKTHTKVKEFMCQYCGKEFLRLNSIKRHLRISHGGQRYQCPICFKLLKGHISDHMRVHEQQRPHECPECGQKFVQSTQLTVHRRLHSGHRPYACRICNLKFGHSNALQVHIRSHTGEKPFSCTMCPFTFSQLPHMKTHMLKIHGKEHAYKCTKCGECFKLKSDYLLHTSDCTAGIAIDELSFEEKIQASIQRPEEAEVESSMTLRKMRYLLALLLSMVATKSKLKYLGFNKRLIDELLEESLEAMGKSPCRDETLTELRRLKTNIEILLIETVPTEQMDKFRYENKSTEEILVLLTDEKKV